MVCVNSPNLFFPAHAIPSHRTCAQIEPCAVMGGGIFFWPPRGSFIPPVLFLWRCLARQGGGLGHSGSARLDSNQMVCYLEGGTKLRSRKQTQTQLIDGESQWGGTGETGKVSAQVSPFCIPWASSPTPSPPLLSVGSLGHPPPPSYRSQRILG